MGIPIAILLVALAAALLAIGAVWFVHLVVGMRKSIEKADKVEEQIANLRSIVEDWMLGNIDKAEAQALFRRAFDDERQKQRAAARR